MNGKTARDIRKLANGDKLKEKFLKKAVQKRIKETKEVSELLDDIFYGYKRIEE